VRIALVQLPMYFAMDLNVQAICAALGEAKRGGADIAVFSECAVTGFHLVMGNEVNREKIASVIETIGASCRKFGIAALFGGPCYGTDQQELAWNSAILLDSNGELQAVWPKIVFTPSETLAAIFQPGPLESRVTVEILGARIGVLICMEFAGVVGGFNSDHARSLFEKMKPRPTVIFVLGVMDLGSTSKAPELAVKLAREWGIPIVLSNAAEWGGETEGCLGGSLAVNCEGNILAVAKFDAPDIQYFNLDF